MLESLPARAQLPIVARAKWTFATARISAASPSVIQSAAAGIGQPVASGEPDDSDAPDAADDEAPLDDEGSDEDEDGFDAALEVLPPRSFLAQPDPL